MANTPPAPTLEELEEISANAQREALRLQVEPFREVYDAIQGQAFKDAVAVLEANIGKLRDSRYQWTENLLINLRDQPVAMLQELNRLDEVFADPEDLTPGPQ